MEIIILLPFILLVRVIAHFDPHLFRYWAVHSMDHWRFWGTTWKGYATGEIEWMQIGRFRTGSSSVGFSSIDSLKILLPSSQP